MSSVMLGCGASDPGTEAAIGGLTTPGGGTGGGTPGGATPGGGTTGGGTGATGGGIGGNPSGGITGTIVTPGGGGSPAGSPVCEVKQVDFLGDAPDMLIVLDRSQSMTLYGRWDPSREAVKQITRDYEGLIGFGLEFFPGNGAADPLLDFLLGDPTPEACAGSIQLDVPIMVRNATAIGTAVDRTMTLGSTPTSAALKQALTILGDRKTQLDTRVKPGFVLLVTDGDPSCKPSLTISDPAGPGDVDQQQLAKDAVTALKAAGIPTYVIGYQIDANRQALMNELAMLGDTGTFKAVGDAAGIVEAFRQITKDVVSCEFDLGEVPMDPKKVRIEIDKKTILLNDPNGWILDGKHVTLQGTACSGLKDGRVHDLNAQVECVDVVLM
jgi:hypothetical protein